MNEYLNNNHEDEQKSIHGSIEALLPRYYEARGDGLRVTVERSIPIDGHEVAWLKYSGKAFDGNEFEEYGLGCACEFTEGIGWDQDEQYGVFGLNGADGCIPRQAAIYLRQQELHNEYAARYKDSAKWGKEYALLEHVPEVILDLIKKDKAGEFIGEGTNGAHFWGGHVYVQTVAAITLKSMPDIWEDIHKMVTNKQIQMEGNVIQEYYEAPEPSWTEYGRIEYEGCTGIAYIPAHSKMSQNWQITILAQDGRILRGGVVGPKLRFSPDFGADESDIESVEASIKEAIDSYLWNPMGQ